MKKRKGAFSKGEWITKKNAQFHSNVRWSAAARSYRIACGITQAEVAKEYGVAPTSVAGWESGRYNWRGFEELAEYNRVIEKLARARGTLKIAA